MPKKQPYSHQPTAALVTDQPGAQTTWENSQTAVDLDPQNPMGGLTPLIPGVPLNDPPKYRVQDLDFTLCPEAAAPTAQAVMAHEDASFRQQPPVEAVSAGLPREIANLLLDRRKQEIHMRQTFASLGHRINSLDAAVLSNSFAELDVLVREFVDSSDALISWKNFQSASKGLWSATKVAHIQLSTLCMIALSNLILNSTPLMFEKPE